MRIIAIASSKGGVGKTTAAINLGAAMYRSGTNNIVLDCNITNPNVGLYLGTVNTPKNLHSALEGRHKLSETVHLHHSGLRVVPGNTDLDTGVEIDVEKLMDIKEDIKSLNGVKILDCASGITKESMMPLALADDVLIVTTPEFPAIMDSLKTIRSARRIGTNVCGVIINRMKSNTDWYVQKIREVLGVPVIGVIPEDDNMHRAHNSKNPIVHSHPDSESSKAFKNIAKRLK